MANVRLNRPWLIAAWPGMGNVALNAAYFLLSKLHMAVFAELDPGDLFDVERVEVKRGIVRTARRPRNHFFVWRDPAGGRDLVVFLGEAQPPLGKYPFCRRIASFAAELGVERVFTFAAMATAMRPEHPSRVFVAATDGPTLDELKPRGLEVLEGGQISGLNGVLLGAAAEAGLRGACLLGEMPQVFSELPFPKASMAVLETFAAAAGLELDLSELVEQARIADRELGELLTRVERAHGVTLEGEETEEDEESDDESEEEFPAGPAEEPEETPAEPTLGPADERRVEELFHLAATDRSKAFELKRDLDRLGVFRDYEDRFLDLFSKPA